MDINEASTDVKRTLKLQLLDGITIAQPSPKEVDVLVRIKEKISKNPEDKQY